MAKARGGVGRIPVVEVDWQEGAVWRPALKGRSRAARSLLTELASQVKEFTGPLGYIVLRAATNAIWGLWGRHFGDEPRQLAELGGARVGDVIIANLAYDLSAGAVGCSTFASPMGKSVMHARNLDWEFPRKLLQKHTLVANVRGAPAGDYAMVTWPGFFGALTAMAPGRFSISVNFVQHPEWMAPTSFLGRAIKGHWPVAWLVRHVLENASDWSEAVKLLSKQPVLAPVLFTVAGAKAGESVIIERTPDKGQVSKHGRGKSAFITNHYAWTGYAKHNVPDEIESGSRFQCLQAGLEEPPQTTAAALALLDHPTLLQDDTQQQVAMNAREGWLSVRVPGGPLTTVNFE